MLARFGQTHQRKTNAAFTLAEIMVALAIFVMVTAGLIFGYTESNQYAEWNAMSLAAQAYAAQGVEQARAAVWSISEGGTGPFSGDELPATNTAVSPHLSYTNYIQTNVMQVPITGNIFYVTNSITISNLQNTTTIPYPVRQIRADCTWKFPSTGKWYTTTVITERAPDQ